MNMNLSRRKIQRNSASFQQLATTKKFTFVFLNGRDRKACYEEDLDILERKISVA
jgi:hypothetical protein